MIDTQPNLEYRRVPTHLKGQRLDQIAAELFPEYSRARLQAWIRSGHLRLNNTVVKPNTKLWGGESLSLAIATEIVDTCLAQPMDLDIVHEDDHILVLNKPAGLVVHPAAGNPDGTLMNALLHHAPQLQAVPRAGIVHRLDKDTTGLMVVAKTLTAQAHLVNQLQSRTMGREYEAIVQGQLAKAGVVNAPIGRHLHQRTKMAVRENGGKVAITHYHIRQSFPSYTHLRLKLETGRTHQIRVHMAHINHPIVGDPVYGGRSKLSKATSPEFAHCIQQLSRQALHAVQLTLVHPDSQALSVWQTSLPGDMQTLLEALQEDTQ